jgi:predicted AlkP superfamily phosphohydrolase/phosphomutase
MVLSLEGARDEWVDGYLVDGTMPNLAALAQRGARAEYAQTIDPSLTTAAHVSIATGAYPSHTGQVSDRFHLPKNPIDWPTSGLDEPEMQVEPLWRTAMRHGQTTAAIFWPGTSVQVRDWLADYTVAYGTRELHSALHVITPTEASEWSGAPDTYTPLLEATLQIRGNEGALVTTLHLLAADSTDDAQENYDTFLLCRRKEVEGDCAAFGVGEWAPLLVRPRLYGGGYFKLLSATSERIEMFQSAIWYNRARPVELLREINDQFGFFPPQPDDQALEQGWITAEDYWNMAERQTRWLCDVIQYVWAEYHPDLSFAWLGMTGSVGHQYLMVDDRQLNYDEETAKAYAEYVRAAYALVDQCLGQILGSVLLGRDSIFLISDHGMAPIHTQVYVNTILEDADLLRYTEGSGYPIDRANSKAVAFASGAAVNVYVNLKLPGQLGAVPMEDYGAVQSEIVEALQGAVGADGEPIFQRVLTGQELSALHLDSPNSGDVFAQAARGYTLTDWPGNPDVLEPAPHYGGQGYDSAWPEMRAILLAAGYGIRSGVQLPAVHLLDVVPTVASLLDVKPTDAAQGRVLHEMLQSQP